MQAYCFSILFPISNCNYFRWDGTPIGLSVAFAPRHGSAVPPPASAPTCKRKSVVTNIFLVACGAGEVRR